MIEVINSGMLCLIVDHGRAGLAHLGVPRSGAADLGSFELANRLVGNPADAAAVEITYGSAALRFMHDVWFAVTGAEVQLTLGGRPVDMNRALRAGSGMRLDIDRPQRGLRSYVAVAGGIAVPAVLGSRSTDTLAGIGPAPLKDGDRLPLGPIVAPPPPSPDVIRSTVPSDAPVTLIYRAGPRDDRFSPDVVTCLERSVWQVGAASNRVGVRLQGDRLPVPESDPLPSEGIVLGAIEVPPSGQPIIFMADHPTTGGYPVIGVVDGPSVAKLAQIPPGTSVRFEQLR